MPDKSYTRKITLFAPFLRWLWATVGLGITTSARTSLHYLSRLWIRFPALGSRLAQIWRSNPNDPERSTMMSVWRNSVLASLEPTSPSTGPRSSATVASTVEGSFGNIEGQPSVTPDIGQATFDRPSHPPPHRHLTAPSTSPVEPMTYPPIHVSAPDTPPSGRGDVTRAAGSLEPIQSITASTRPTAAAREESHSVDHRTPASGLEPIPPSSSGDDYLRKHNVIPISIESVKRYNRAPIKKFYDTHCKIKPMKLQHTRGILPTDWTEYLHPEGAVYFHHKQQDVLTDADLYHGTTRHRIEGFMRHIASVKNRYFTQFPAATEIVLELSSVNDDEQAGACYYYCINHDHRTMFWLDEFDAGSMLKRVKGLSSNAQIRHELEAQYWTHWEYFPLNREIPEILLRETVGRLFHGATDQKLSKVSTFPFTTEDIRDLLDLIKHVKFTKELHGFSAVVIGRIMTRIARFKFLNNHGSPNARLRGDQRIYYEEKRPSLKFRFISVFFFGSPRIHYQNIQKVWVDDTVTTRSLARCIQQIQFEWDKYLLPATVMLSANLALQAISDLNYFSLVASYISTFANLTSFICTMFLYRIHRWGEHLTADEMRDYLRHWTRYGIEKLAIVYSVPYVFMMWGMLYFFLAFVIQVLLNASGDPFLAVPNLLFYFSVGVIPQLYMRFRQFLRSRRNLVDAGVIFDEVVVE